MAIRSCVTPCDQRTYPFLSLLIFLLFFFNDTATPEIYTLSLHDALPIFDSQNRGQLGCAKRARDPRARRVQAPLRGTGRHRRRHDQGRHSHGPDQEGRGGEDRKSTRLNSSHPSISYAVFCLKKKTKTTHK